MRGWLGSHLPELVCDGGGSGKAGGTIVVGVSMQSRLSGTCSGASRVPGRGSRTGDGRCMNGNMTGPVTRPDLSQYRFLENRRGASRRGDTTRLGPQ